MARAYRFDVHWLISQVSTSAIIGEVMPVGAGVGLEGDPQPARAERGDLAAGQVDRGAGVPFAVDRQDAQAPALLQATQRAEPDRAASR